MKRILILLCGLFGCGGSERGDGDIVGPFTGEARRFVIDRFELPVDGTTAREYGGDLDGDETRDNQAGMVIGTLTSLDDVTLNAADMIASGAIASVVEVQADDFLTDGTAGVTYFGAEGEPASVMGGTITGGVFVSNRTATSAVPGDTTLRLPLFRDADPMEVSLRAMQIDLVPDGAGGYDALINGCIPSEAARAATFTGIVQMLDNDPAHHLVFARIMDLDRDGTISRADFDANNLIASLLADDLDLDDVGACLSIGFRAHLAPCPSGRCTEPPADLCHDRVLDGTETAVDCGGPCLACAAGEACSTPDDCQSTHCDAGTCRAPTCDDGVRDGLESDIDCGGECGPCARGRVCADQRDCAEDDICDAGTIGGVGVCKD